VEKLEMKLKSFLRSNSMKAVAGRVRRLEARFEWRAAVPSVAEAILFAKMAASLHY
jgi:hypothetical protein